LWRWGCLGLAATDAAATLHAVLCDERLDLWQLEDLATLDADDLGVNQVGAAVRAHLWDVDQYLVGIGDLCQVLALGAWLLARSTLRRPPLGSTEGRWLGESLR
jgi:hypothetical protein